MSCNRLFWIFLIVVAGFNYATPASAARRSVRVKKQVVAPAEPVDWSSRAAAELDHSAEPAAPVTSTSTETSTASMTPPATPVTVATVRAEVPESRSLLERTSLRLTFLFEPYQPNGTARLGSGQEVTYSELPTSVLGQLDLRWLPFSVGQIAGQNAVLGGYVAGGYARQSVPLVAPSGFRYDDVTLNTLRFEAGAAAGIPLAQVSNLLNLEVRLGFGRSSVVQTSRYSEVVGSFARPFISGALDFSYHLTPRFALMASIARRSPLGDGSGALGFDPLTVSGGFLVQVR